jgi:hypothetical protein
VPLLSIVHHKPASERGINNNNHNKKPCRRSFHRTNRSITDETIAGPMRRWRSPSCWPCSDDNWCRCVCAPSPVQTTSPATQISHNIVVLYRSLAGKQEERSLNESKSAESRKTQGRWFMAEESLLASLSQRRLIHISLSIKGSTTHTPFRKRDFIWTTKRQV